MSFLVLQLSSRGKGCLLCFYCLADVLLVCVCSMALPSGAVGWVGLQCVIVLSPDHTHLHFVEIMF